MPADFLINEEGKIVDASYGKTMGTHMDLKKVEAWAGVQKEMEVVLQETMQ